jgi:DNA invertase Pin-like site-specific DNA recombinase
MARRTEIGREPTVAVQAAHIRAMHAIGEKPAHITRRLGVARSNVRRMLENAPGPTGALAAEANG